MKTSRVAFFALLPVAAACGSNEPIAEPEPQAIGGSAGQPSDAATPVETGSGGRAQSEAAPSPDAAPDAGAPALFGHSAYVAPTPTGTAYYIDSVHGADQKDGRSAANAWKSFANLDTTPLAPGDAVLLARGSTFTQMLQVTDSGTVDHPILFSTFGTGERPIVTLANSWTVVQVTGSYVVLDGLRVTGADKEAITVQQGAEHDVLHDIEIDQSGAGITLQGAYSLVTDSYAHDLHMIVNTQGGDDDYGAVGYTISAPDCEIAYSRCVRCSAPSYDYVLDGGTVELYGTVDNARIHHNWGEQTTGFVEAGGGDQAGRSAQHIVIAYNVFLRGTQNTFVGFHTGATFGVTVSDVVVENNTVVSSDGDPGHSLFEAWEGPVAGAVVLRNNVIDSSSPFTNKVANFGSTFVHDHNLFRMRGGAKLGVALGPTELQGDPLFVDASSGDLRLGAGSPAIDKGEITIFASDIRGAAVPQGSAPDIGAYESSP